MSSRAIASGYDAFCLTVDSALYSRRERDIARRFAKPWRGDTGMEYQASLSWDQGTPVPRASRHPADPEGHCDRRRCRTRLPGRCRRGLRLQPRRPATRSWRGHDGRVARNRSGGPPGRTRVIVDGGISRGSDVIKAIAMGADMVGIGRLYCYGLAAAGGRGRCAGDRIAGARNTGMSGIAGFDRLQWAGRLVSARRRTGDTPACLQRVPAARPTEAQLLIRA